MWVVWKVALRDYMWAFESVGSSEIEKAGMKVVEWAVWRAEMSEAQSADSPAGPWVVE